VNIKPLITDLVQIERLGEKGRAENERFRKHLKTHDYNERRLRRTAEAIEEQIDCTQCANCCRVASIELNDRDVERLTAFLKIKRSAFLEQYTVENTEDGTTDLRRTESGCVFLSGNDCLVYEARPDGCRYFPHLVRGQGPISTRMWQFIDRACYCPIVYNALEAFKEETHFRR